MPDPAPLSVSAPRGAPADVVSVAEIARRDSMSYMETADRLHRSGKIQSRDPRAHLNPSRVRQFATLKQDDLIREYGRLLESGARSAPDRESKIRYLAALKLHRRSMAMKPDARTFAKVAEKSALHLVVASPGDARARDALAMTAGLNDRAQRDYAMRGFSGPNATIAKAAKMQGRSWIEVRDDLVKYNVLPRRDPRRRIKASDIKDQKKGGIRAKATLPSDKLERSAMKILKKNPKDQQAMSWLTTAGALEDSKNAKKVKGTLPKRRLMDLAI